jgi:hypothetical protein
MKKTLLVFSYMAFLSVLSLAFPLECKNNSEIEKDTLQLQGVKKQETTKSENKTKTSWNSLSEDKIGRIGELAIREVERYAYGPDYSVSAIKKTSDFAGNDYALITFLPQGYAVYNLSSGDFCEVSPLGHNPFSQYESAVEKVYTPLAGFFVKGSDSCRNVSDDTVIKSDATSNYKDMSESIYGGNMENHSDSGHLQFVQNGMICYSSGNTPHYPVSQGMLTADHEVPYSWFFKENNTKFAAEDVQKGTETPHWECGYVAAAMLLSYQEFFKSTGYFNAYEVSQFINVANVTSYTNGIPDDVPEVKDSFLQYFWDLHQSWGSTASTIKAAVAAFMDASGKNRVYEDYCYDWITATVTDPLKDGVPDLLFGNLPAPNDTTYEGGSTMGNHTIVVYGYYDSDSKLLAHYGWDGYSQVILTTPDIFHLGGVYAIYNKSPHVHNRYFKKGSLYYCGCGALMSC